VPAVGRFEAEASSIRSIRGSGNWIEGMIVDKAGYVTDRIILMGRKESCVYLLKGENEYALLGGGMVHIVPEIMEQLQTFKIEEEKIKRIIILHSHFDHCGVVPFYKKRWPWVQITASARAKELLSDPKVIEAISSLNQMLIDKYGREEVARKLELKFTGISVDEVVTGGEVLPCGDLPMEIIAVPGHSSCSIAVYVEKEKALFGSDAGGIPFDEKICTAANSNFDQYEISLEKMAGYAPEIYLAEHFGALTENDGRHFLYRSMDSAKRTRRFLEKSLSRTKSVEKSTTEVSELMMATLPGELFSKEVVSMVIGQMLSYLAKRGSVSN